MKFFKNISTHPALYFLLVSVIVWVGLEWYWEAVCKNSGCTYVMRYSIIQPAIVYVEFVILLSGLFLIVPRHYGRSWLFFMAPWAIPLMVAFAVSIEGGSFLSISHKAASILATQIVGAATLIFVVGKALLIKFKLIK